MLNNRARNNFEKWLLILEKTPVNDPSYLDKFESLLTDYPFYSQGWRELALIYHEDQFNKSKSKET
jgi:hypothetical protein